VCGFRSFFTPLTGVLLTFRSPYYPLSVAKEYLALGGGPPGFMRASTRLALLEESSKREARFHLRGYHPLWLNFRRFGYRSTLSLLQGSAGPTRLSQPPLHNGRSLGMQKVWAFALSLATTHAVEAFFPFLRVLRCVRSPRWLPASMDSMRDTGA
jgi:hypothetical protein